MIHAREFLEVGLYFFFWGASVDTENFKGVVDLVFDYGIGYFVEEKG